MSASATGGATLRQVTGGGIDFDAVLLDLMMPDMTGHELAAAIRSVPRGRELPLLCRAVARLLLVGLVSR